MPSIREQAVITLEVKGDGTVIGQLRNVQSAAEKTFSSTEKSVSAMEKSIVSGFRSMINQYASFVAAWQAGTKILSSGMEFNKFVENQTTSFAVMMKSAEKAQTMMSDLYNFAVNSPLTFKDTASASKQLMAYGFAAKELIPTMQTLGTVAIATGNRLDDIAYVYGTLRSQGRAYSRDLMQFGMRGIPIYEELAKVMGVDASQIQKMASEGKISFTEVEKAMQNMTSNGGRFAGTIEQYMNTLSGKTSMLTDMWQKSAGSLTGGIFGAMKGIVDDLISTMGDAGFQSYLKDMSNDLGSITTALGEVLQVVIKLLPLITTFVKLWITFKALNLVTDILGKLPSMLTSIGKAAGSAAITIGNIGSGLTTWGASLTTALANATSGIAMLGREAAAFIAMNPWILAAGIVAVGATAAYSAAKDKAEKNRTSTSVDMRQYQLSLDTSATAFSSAQAGATRTKTIEDVKKIAEQYKIAEGVVGTMYVKQGLLAKSAWDYYINTKAATSAIEEQKKISDAMANAKSTRTVQAEFLSGLTKESMDRYYDPDGYYTLGTRGANDYIQSFADEMQKQKDIYGSAFTKDIAGDLLQKEYDALTKTLVEGASVDKLFDATGFDETIRARMQVIQKELAALGKKAKELKLIDLGSWWLDQEWAVKRTTTAMDDLSLEQEKTVDSAKKEIAARVANIDNNLAYYAVAGGHEEEINALLVERNNLLNSQVGILNNISKEYSKQKKLKLFSDATEGNGAFFDNLKAGAVDAFREALIITYRDTGVQKAMAIAGRVAEGVGKGTAAVVGQGTEAGSIGSNFAANGAQAGIIGIIINAISSIGKFLSSIEDVSKAMNPFTTMLEAARETLEPLLNAASGPLVSFLEQFGEVIGKILTPVIQLWQIAESLSYILNIGLIAALQVVSDAFTWFADHVIVPIGNFIIDAINAVIHIINKIPGVELDYLDRLDTSVERIAKALNAKLLISSMQYAVDKLNGLIDDQMASWKDLYEVGAISGSQYEAEIAALNSKKVDLDQELVDVAVAQLNTVDELYAWIQDNMSAYLAAKDDSSSTATTTTTTSSSGSGSSSGIAVIGGLIGQTVSNIADTAVDVVDTVVDVASDVAEGIGDFFGFAVGTPEIPYDMIAQLHQGEGVIPATFMDGIRSGDLALSNGDMGMGGQSTNVYVTVQGSVTSENDLITAVATGIATKRSRGILTA